MVVIWTRTMWLTSVSTRMPVRFKRMHYYHVPVSPDRHRIPAHILRAIEHGLAYPVLHVNPFKGKLLSRCVYWPLTHNLFTLYSIPSFAVLHDYTP